MPRATTCLRLAVSLALLATVVMSGSGASAQVTCFGRAPTVVGTPGDDSLVGTEGVDVIELPCLKTQPLADVSALAAAIGRLRPDDWLVVTSRPGADAVARAGESLPRPRALRDPRRPSGARVAPGTRGRGCRAARARGPSAAFLPSSSAGWSAATGVQRRLRWPSTARRGPEREAPGQPASPASVPRTAGSPRPTSR